MILSGERKCLAIIESDAPLIIDSCGTKSTSQRCLNVYIHFCTNIYMYIYVHTSYIKSNWRRIYALNCQWLIPRMPPLPTPFSQMGFSAAIVRIQAYLKLYMTQREKMSEKNAILITLTWAISDWFAFNSYVLLSNRIMFCNLWRNQFLFLSASTSHT